MTWAPFFTQFFPSDSSGVPAELTGFCLKQADRRCFPQLQASEGSVSGMVYDDLPADVIDRLSYFAAGLGARAITGEVKIGAQHCDATYFGPASEPQAADQEWQPDPWRADWGQMAVFAAEEVLQHYGSVPPDVLARMMPMIEVRASARVAAGRGVPTEVRSAMTSDSVEVLERHNRHAGFFLTREYTLRHPEFGGGTSPAVKREVFVATDAAIVLPYDPIRDRVLLVEQFRMGPFGRGDPYPWMLEPVAGRVDPDETPEETAHRECTEEAGLALDHLEHIASHYCSLGCSTEYFHCYVGLCDLPDLSPGSGGLDSEDEDIRTHVLPFDQAMALIPSGEAANGPLILSLLWLERERERLRSGA